MKLRLFQQKNTGEISEHWRAKRKHVLWYLPTGGGKSFVASWMIKQAAARNKTSWFMVHRRELIKQVADALTEHDVDFGFIASKRDMAVDRPVQICSIPTLARRIDQLILPDFAVLDECFPAGSLVDGLPIESYSAGDMVRSFNHETSSLEYRKVVRVFQSVPHELCRLRLSNGRTIVCTPGHPFHTEKGYIDASSLLGTTLTSLRDLRKSGVLIEQRETGQLPRTWAYLLQRYLLKYIPIEVVFGDNGAYEQEIRISKNDGTQSNEFTRSQRAHEGDIKGYWPWSEVARRKWERHDNSSGSIAGAIGAWICVGACRLHENAAWKWLPHMLQVGYSSSIIGGWHRGRWLQPHGAETPRTRPKKSKLPHGIRVESVEILKPTSDGAFGGMLPGGYVYNLEVEQNHNYFVDGLLVHNCHHIACDSWSSLMAKFADTYTVGLSATPIRQDGRGLAKYFDAMVLGPSINELISDRFLSPFVTYAPPTVDTSKIHTRYGEYVAAESSALMDKPSITGSAVDEYRKLCDGKRAIVFCCSVEHSKHVAAQFRDAGYAAAHIDGTTADDIRDGAISDFERGSIQVLTNVDLCGEGLSINAIECVILLRPTQSVGLWLQQVGRGLRTWPGKERLVILDHVGMSQKFGLIDDQREWSLTQDEERKKKAEASDSVRICGHCWAATRSRAKECADCGLPFPIKSREVETRNGELVQLTPEMLALAAEKRRAHQEIGMAKTLQDLIRIEKARKYKPGWALKVFQGKQRKRNV